MPSPNLIPFSSTISFFFSWEHRLATPNCPGLDLLEEFLLCLLHELGLTAGPGAGRARQPLRQVARALLTVLQGLLVSGGGACTGTVLGSHQIMKVCHHSDDGDDKDIDKVVDNSVANRLG